NDGNNILTDSDGFDADTLSGGLGNDTLNADPAGRTMMLGGAGDDVYNTIYSESGSHITENPDEGHDVVNLTVGTINRFDTYSLPSNVEDLSLGNPSGLLAKTPENAFQLSLVFTVYGNSEDNFITGDVRNDSIYGSDGNDTLDGGPGADTLTGSTGN